MPKAFKLHACAAFEGIFYPLLFAGLFFLGYFEQVPFSLRLQYTESKVG